MDEGRLTVCERTPEERAALECMMGELAAASCDLAYARMFVTEVRELHEPPGVIEASFRVVEDARTGEAALVLPGDVGAVVETGGDVRAD